MLGALRCRGCGPGVSRRCLGCRGRCRGRVPGRGAVPDAPRPRPGARPGPSPAEAPAVGAAAGLRSRHRSRRPHGAPDGAAGPARELSPEPPRYRIPAKTGNPPSPSRAFSPRPLELGVLSAPAPGTGHPAPLSAPSPIPGILPRLALPEPRTAHPPARDWLPLSSPPREWWGFAPRPVRGEGDGWGQEQPPRVPPHLPIPPLSGGVVVDTRGDSWAGVCAPKPRQAGQWGEGLFPPWSTDPTAWP